MGCNVSLLLFNTAQSDTYDRLWSLIILSFMSLGFIFQGRISFFSHPDVSTCTTYVVSIFSWSFAFGDSIPLGGADEVFFSTPDVFILYSTTLSTLTMELSGLVYTCHIT